MLYFLTILSNMTKIQVFITAASNLLLIYITLFHVKQIVGTYKYMIIIFSFLGIGFSISDQVAKPVIYSYAGALLCFSYGDGWFDESLEFRQAALAIYSGIYMVILALAAAQFVYRYLALVHPDLTKWFKGFGIMAWVCYPISHGVVNGLLIFLLASPDEYSDQYLR